MVEILFLTNLLKLPIKNINGVIIMKLISYQKHVMVKI